VAIFLSWIVLAILVAVFAANKGLNAFLAFLAATLLSPLIGFIIVACLKDKKAAIEAEVTAKRLAEHSAKSTAAEVSARIEKDRGYTRDCPRCAEHIKFAAVVCRFCGAEFDQDGALLASPPQSAPT